HRELWNQHLGRRRRYDERGTEHVQPLTGMPHRRKVEEPDAVRVPGCGTPGSLERATGLSHAAGPEHRDDTVLLEKPEERCDLCLAADQRLDPRRHARREWRFETRPNVHRLGVGANYRADVAVTGAMDRLDVPWLGNIVAKGAARQRDQPVQRRGRNVAVAPDRIQQLIARHQLIRSLQQLRDHREYSRLECNLAPSMQEAAVAQVDQEFAAAILESTHRECSTRLNDSADYPLNRNRLPWWAWLPTLPKVNMTRQPMRIATVLALLLFAASSRAMAQTAIPAASPALLTPPTRPADGPGAPHWTVMGPGMNAPADRNGDFEIGPDYKPSLEAGAVAGRLQGTVRQFTMDSKDSKLYPGIGRDVFGTVDPDNPRTLIVKTHAEPWRRAITVYIPAQYKRGTKAPLIVVN